MDDWRASVDDWPNASVDDWPNASVDDAGVRSGSPPSRVRAGRASVGSRRWARTGGAPDANPASCGVRFSFLALQRRQAATTFSHVWVPPAGARDHVIQVLRRRGAVLTRPFVTGEDRSTGEWSVRTVGHANVPAEPDHGGRLHRDRRRSEHHAVRDDDLGLLLQDQHHGSARGNHREGRIGRVEHEGATHAAKSSLQPPMRAVRRSRTGPGGTNHTRVILPRTRRVGSAEMPEVANRGRAGRRPAGPARRFTSGQASPPVRRGSPPGNLR